VAEVVEEAEVVGVEAAVEAAAVEVEAAVVVVVVGEVAPASV
jgi:hypothetical protein